MSLAAAVDFICGPLASYLTAPIGRARAAEAPCTGNPNEDYLSESENSTSGSEPGSGIGYKYSGDCQQTRCKHLPGSPAISSLGSATARSVDRVGSAEDFESASFANPDAKVQSDQDSGFFGFPSSKRSFTIPFVSDLQSKLLAVTGIGAFGGPKGTNTAEGQLLSEFILSSAENPASSEATGSSVLPCSIKPPCGSHSANAAVSPSPRSQLASTFCPQFCRSELSSAPGTRNLSHSSNTSSPITKRRSTGIASLKGPFANFVHLPPPPPRSEQIYTTLPRSTPQWRSTPGATRNPTLNTAMADPALTSSPKSTTATPKNIPWNRVYEIHTSQLRGHLRFLKLLAANKGHSQPLTQCISRAETLLKDATTAAAASGISTAGPVPAKPEKRRRSVRFEDEVTKQGKSGKKTKTAHTSTQRPKMRHAKPSEAQIAALSSALGKRGRDEPSDSDDSSVGGATNGGRVLRKKIRKEYFTPGMILEFESSDDEDDEEFAPSGKEEEEEEEEKLGADSDSDDDEDGEEVEQDPSPSPEVDRKRSKDGGMEGKRAADNDIDRMPTGKENVDNNTTTAKDVPESSKKRKVVVVSIPKRTAPSTEEEREAGRGKRIRPS
ncbi:hypothetical protein B9Z19DRAFT_1137608 [Tuber borchii]|uniref:Uncharacterized protein n=1 Tax=Tuber borchii TaxID=42251 RepID=A0A2T6ZAD8_TUBBO|nr:hypothetical protein B9Z19DRAFT_1137608 [Tuber borchii]